jgi:hypothetical protein
MDWWIGGLMDWGSVSVGARGHRQQRPAAKRDRKLRVVSNFLFFRTWCGWDSRPPTEKGSLNIEGPRYPEWRPRTCYGRSRGYSRPDPTLSTYALHFTNSILAHLYNLIPPPTANSSVEGDHNGFDANTPRFGLNATVDSGADRRSLLSEIQTPADTLWPITKSFIICAPARLSSASVRPSSARLCNPTCPKPPSSCERF